MNKPLFVFESPIFTRSGYGGWAETIAKSLAKYDKIDLKIFPTRWGCCSKKNIQVESIKDTELQSLIPKVLTTPLNKQPEIYCKMSIPNEFQPVGKFNLGMTAGIETTIAAGPWIEGMNRMTHNISISKHAFNVFNSANYTKHFPDGRNEVVRLEKPCDVLFWGINTNVFKKMDVKNEHLEKFMSTIKENFAFLFVGQWTSNNLSGDRKDIGMLIKTFIEAFRDVPKESKPCLILKTNGAALCKMDKYECINKLKSIVELVGGDKSENPNIYILHGELTDEEMNALYNHPKVKSFVTFTHGEGFGMPILEATLSGKPVLVPNWSGHLDYLNPKLCKLLPGELKQIPSDAINDWFVKESSWFYVNYAAAMEIMRNVFEHYESYLIKAEELRKENESKFSVDVMDKQFHALLDTILPQFSVQQNIILPKLKKINIPKINL